MDVARKHIIEQNEISQIYTFALGKIPQKVLIEGRSRHLPVVITLHGGPGSPIPFSVGCRGMFPEFTDRFIMVYWDQLGCGINDYKLKEEFTIESFAEMTANLIAEVKKLFPDNKLLLFGMSWGSVLALKVLQKAEGCVEAVVAWGQVLRNLFLNEEVYAALEQAGLAEKKIHRIRAMRVETLNEKDMKLLTGSIRKYTDGYTNKKGEQVPVLPIVRDLLASEDYTMKDFKAIMVNGTASAKGLLRELLQLDLTEELLAVNIPYYILQGDTDIVTSTRVIQKEVEMCDNPNLHVEVIENTGHMPGKAGMEAVLRTLTKEVTSLPMQ